MAFCGVPHASTRFTLLSEAAYNGSAVGMTQEPMVIEDHYHAKGAAAAGEPLAHSMDDHDL